MKSSLAAISVLTKDEAHPLGISLAPQSVTQGPSVCKIIAKSSMQ